MKIDLKSSFIASMLSSILMLILGILLFFYSTTITRLISYVLAATIIAAGVLAIIRFIQYTNTKMNNELDKLYGAISIIFGILLIKNPDAIVNFIPIVIGIVIILKSAIKIQYAFELKSQNNNIWVKTIIISIISTICGLLLVLKPEVAREITFQIVGTIIIIYALLDIISSLLLKKNIKKTNKKIDVKIQDAEIVKEEQADE